MSSPAVAAPTESVVNVGTIDKKGNQPIPNPKSRVRRACEYCRRKRLKCTAGERPCLNCQLYGAECVSRPEPPRAKRLKSRLETIPHAACDATTTKPVSTNAPSSRFWRLSPGLSDHDNQESIQVPPPPNDPGLFAQQDQLPDFFASPTSNSLPTLEHIVNADINFTNGFWPYDNFVTGEQSAAEQLLALQSPPATESTIATSSISAAGSQRGMGKIIGAERLTTQPTMNKGSISSGIMNRKPSGDSVLLGFTSTAALFTYCIQEKSLSSSRQSDAESLRFIVDCSQISDEISCTIDGDTPPPPISSDTQAAQCINNFFEDLYPPHPIFDRAEIGALLDRYVCQGHRSLDPRERSMFYLITALGSSSRSSKSDNIPVDHENLYVLAWNLFPHAVASPSIISVQIILLHVMYNIFWSKWGIAWMLCGFAVRVAQSVGLHLTSPQNAGMDLAELRLRARLWAVTICLDAYLSMNQGRPPASQASQTDADLFSNENGLLNVSELAWPLSEILIWRVEMARIQQRLNHVFTTKMTTEQRLVCLKDIDAEILKWKEQLPLEFRPEQQVIVESDGHMEIYLLHLDYFNLLRTLHWGLTTHRPWANLVGFSIPRIHASESICLGACLSLVRTLTAMTDRDTRARSFRSRSDHLLSALAIVNRDIMRNPGKLSARTNLEYLKVMRQHLRMMAKGHLLAASLTTFIETTVKAAEQLVEKHS